MEVVARKKAERFLSKKIYACGLFVDKEIGYLAASPGDLVYYNIYNLFKILKKKLRYLFKKKIFF